MHNPLVTRRTRILFLCTIVVGCLLMGITVALNASASPFEEEIFEDPVSGQTVGIVTFLSAITKNSGLTDVKNLAAVDVEQLALKAINDRASQLGLSDPTVQLKNKKSDTDELGVVHVQFQQVISQVPIFGSEITVHLNSNKDSVLINGRTSKRSLNDVIPKINPADALKRAEDTWRREYSTEPILKGTPALFVLDTGLLEDLSSGNVYLAYQVDLGMANQSFRYFVDAVNGTIVYKLPLSTHATRRWVYDCSFDDGNCYLGAYSPFYDYFFGRSEGQASRGANPVNKPLIQSYPYETDRLYFFLGEAYNYYLATFNRNGANGVGGLGDGSAFPIDTTPAVSYADYKLPGIGCPNALFNQMLSRLEFCTGLMLIDIVGHEFTHAVIHYSADLLYKGQSGALNESFADIFGEAIERYQSGSHDWLLGAGSLRGILRSMIDPTVPLYDPYSGAFSNGSQPDRFHSSLYQCGAGDNEGVHSNSGVLNHAAYLIAAGGAFNGCTIRGLGEAKMEQIMYRALTRYLQSTSRFYDAYVAIRTAALDLYTLEDYREVEKSLRAVELPQAGYCSGLSAVDTGCAALVDNCPNHDNQLDPGVCGCGFSSADQNGNGQADCFDPTSATVPSAPSVSVRKTRAQIALQSVPGATYKLVLTMKGAKPKKVATKINPYAAKLSKGSWIVTYQITLGGVTTKSSGKKSFKVK